MPALDLRAVRAAVLLLLAPSLSLAAETGPCAGKQGPDCLIDFPAVLDRSTLALTVEKPSELRIEGATVTVVEIHFDGAPWKGSRWRHHLRLYLPAEESKRDAAAIYAEVSADRGMPHELVFEIFGARTAAITGVPTAVVGSIPPRSPGLDMPRAVRTRLEAHPECQGLGDETAWMECAMRVANETGDHTWSPFAAMAAAYLRTAVALDAASPKLAALGVRGFKPSRFVVGGYSKRGNAQWIAAAARAKGSPKIAGAWIGGSVFPDQPGLALRITEQFGDPSKKWTTATAYYETDAGKRWLQVNDPLSWKERLRDVKLSMWRGTDDELWPLGEAATIEAAFPSLGDVSYLGDANHVVRGRPEELAASGKRVGAPPIGEALTLFSREATASWRGLILSSLRGARPLRIEASREGRRVDVRCAGTTPDARIRLWWTIGIEPKPLAFDSMGAAANWGKDDLDPRDAAWAVMELSPGSDGSWSGMLPEREALPRNALWFVDVLEPDRFVSTEPAPF